jgi:cobalt transporter subunit CbtB
MDMMTEAVVANRAQIDRASSTLPGILVMMFGLFLVLGAGFAGPSVVHNAAHDTRHANSFPCH